MRLVKEKKVTLGGMELPTTRRCTRGWRSTGSSARVDRTGVDDAGCVQEITRD